MDSIDRPWHHLYRAAVWPALLGRAPHHIVADRRDLLLASAGCRPVHPIDDSSARTPACGLRHGVGIGWDRCAVLYGPVTLLIYVAGRDRRHRSRTRLCVVNNLCQATPRR